MPAAEPLPGGLSVNPKGALMPKSPHLEPPSPTPIRPSGARRLNLDMRDRLDQADGVLRPAAGHREAVALSGGVSGG